MKKLFSICCLCAVLILCGCAKKSGEKNTDDVSEVFSNDNSDSCEEPDLSGENSEGEQVSAVTAESSEAENSSSSPDEDTLQAVVTVENKYDTVIVNQAVEDAVNRNQPEQANPQGWYCFSWQDFGQVYSNEELENCFERINEICVGATFSLSFSYKNMDSGARVDYQPYTDYLTCSTIKAPYVKSLLEQGIDLDEVILKDTIWPDDDGSVASSDKTSFTAKELIEYTILESDNTAYYLLVRHYGYWKFNQLMYNIGSGTVLGADWIFTYCNCKEMLNCYEDIYNFALENSRGKWLVDLLSDTDINIQIGKALGGKYTVAQKFGSEFQEYYFNDCAIVYADSPFVLTVFTNQYPETEQACKVFKELAVVFDDINTLLVTE